MKGNQYRPAIWETVTMLLNEDTGYGLLERPLGWLGWIKNRKEATDIM